MDRHNQANKDHQLFNKMFKKKDSHSENLQAKYRQMWNDPKGRAVLSDILLFSGIISDPLQAPLINNGDTALLTVGRQQVGNYIMNFLDGSVDLLIEAKQNAINNMYPRGGSHIDAEAYEEMAKSQGIEPVESGMKI